MCPACVSSAVLYFAGGGSAGGLALWMTKWWKRKKPYHASESESQH